MRKLAYFVTCLAGGMFIACTAENQPNDTAHERRNILWFDATANFKRFSEKDSITFYLEKSKAIGISDVVVDVKPITGEVLYPSKLAPQMIQWEGEYESGTKDTTWDMLSFFIEEGHRLGLAVHASTNVFVAGHNFFDRGVVYTDEDKQHWQTISYLPEGMTPITEQKKKYSAMLNPALPEVQDYELSIIKELVASYPQLDGIILDRVRYDGIEADFSDASRDLFEAYLGRPVENFPAAIFSYDSGEGKDRIEGPLYKNWLEWRAKVIHDFIYRAREEVKQINPDISFGDYTGSWYPLYYDVGVNFASREYDPSIDFEWATPEYKQFGYAEALDLFTTGNYYVEVEKKETEALADQAVRHTESGLQVGAESWYTVEGSAELVNEVTKGKVPVYAGLYVEQYKGDPEQFVKAIKMCRSKSQGVMVFDIVHVINFGWWDYLEEGLK
ncbi:alpha amylase family protein [Parapedobacter deserti]|uniref:Alpha amylase family protein n=1 Tax=Parapedobacter deserti TaxID=1912957 RepID=A0ABV7JDA5_9SPHI